MSFYKPLVYVLYPEYIPPNKFVVPLPNQFSWVIQFALQNQKKLYIYKLLVREEDKQIYHRLFMFHRRLSKFVTHVKYRIVKCANIVNLYGDTLKQHHISIIENNKMYKFDYFEMFKIIKEKIYYHEHFFLLPMMPTNPYTNVHFELHNLYNIYLQLLRSLHLLPIHMKLFLNVNFDVTRLIEKYSYNILIEIITDDYNRLTLSSKYSIMRDMFITLKKRIFLNIPNERLYQLFHKQVLDYYKATYLPPWCSRLILYQLKRYIIVYHKKNPNMGKTIRNVFTNEIIVC
jgi:hypothetical protein